MLANDNIIPFPAKARSAPPEGDEPSVVLERKIDREGLNYLFAVAHDGWKPDVSTGDLYKYVLVYGKFLRLHIVELPEGEAAPYICMAMIESKPGFYKLENTLEASLIAVNQFVADFKAKKKWSLDAFVDGFRQRLMSPEAYKARLYKQFRSNDPTEPRIRGESDFSSLKEEVL